MQPSDMRRHVRGTALTAEFTFLDGPIYLRRDTLRLAIQETLEGKHKGNTRGAPRRYHHFVESVEASYLTIGTC